VKLLTMRGWEGFELVAELVVVCEVEVGEVEELDVDVEIPEEEALEELVVLVAVWVIEVARVTVCPSLLATVIDTDAGVDWLVKVRLNAPVVLFWRTPSDQCAVKAYGGVPPLALTANVTTTTPPGSLMMSTELTVTFSALKPCVAL